MSLVRHSWSWPDQIPGVRTSCVIHILLHIIGSLLKEVLEIAIVPNEQPAAHNAERLKKAKVTGG